jgi:hypothetical protein
MAGSSLSTRVTRTRRKLRECFFFNLAVCLVDLQLNARLRMIDRGVAQGSHYVECILMGIEDISVPPFKLIGVFTT